jgi:hypothetical protein
MRLGEAEVEDLDLVVVRDHDVGRPQITMNHAFFVCGFEALGNLAAHFKCLLYGQRAAFQAVSKGLPLDQVQHKESQRINSCFRYRKENAL